MVVNQAHDVESVRYDSGIWEPFFDESSIGAGQVDADDANLVASL